MGWTCSCRVAVVMNALVYADDVADDMLVLRHEKDLNGCSEDGVFKKCGCSTPVVYCFLATLSSRSSGTRCAGADVVHAVNSRTHSGVVCGRWKKRAPHFPFSIFYITRFTYP